METTERPTPASIAGLHGTSTRPVDLTPSPSRANIFTIAELEDKRRALRRRLADALSYLGIHEDAQTALTKRQYELVTTRIDARDYTFVQRERLNEALVRIGTVIATLERRVDEQTTRNAKLMRRQSDCVVRCNRLLERVHDCLTDEEVTLLRQTVQPEQIDVAAVQLAVEKFERLWELYMNGNVRSIKSGATRHGRNGWFASK